MNQAESSPGSHPETTELDRIGGRTQLITTNGFNFSQALPMRSQTASRPSTVESSNSHVGTFAMDSVHPSLMNDIRVFENMGGEFQTQFDVPADSTQSDMMFDFFQALESQQAVPQAISQNAVPVPYHSPQQQQFSYRPYPDMYVEDMFSAPSAPVSSPSSFTATSSASPEEPPVPPPNVPTLDASWQSFVEQLGFGF